MGKLNDMNVTNLEKGKMATFTGSAHERIVTGILIRLGFEVATADVASTPYDLLVHIYESPGGKRRIIKAQIKTVENSVSFHAGSRGGIDREYKSGVKAYKYTEEHNDVIFGIQKETLDVYVVPTRFIKNWGESRSVSKLQILKNNWDVLLNWNKEYLDKLETQLD